MVAKGLEGIYKQQLKHTCISLDCTSIFCELKEDEAFLDFLKQKLVKYGGVFLCTPSDYNKVNERNSVEHDFLLEIALHFSYGKEFHDLCTKDFHYLFRSKTCKLFKKGANNSFLITNEKKLLNLILNKTLRTSKAENINNICYLFIKLYILFTDFIQIDEDNFVKFVELFLGLKLITNENPKCKEINFKCALPSYSVLSEKSNNISSPSVEFNQKLGRDRLMFSPSLLVDQATRGPKATKLNSCLFTKELTKYQFGKLIETFKKNITKLNGRELATCPELKCYLNVLMLLYELNENYKIFPCHKFYLIEFCAKMNFETERINKKKKTNSVLNYYFALPLNVKSKEIKMNNFDIMKTKLKDAFFRAMFQGEVSPYLKISVNRNSFYNETLKIIENAEIESLKKQLKVSFINEEGVDSGGITKEFFQLLSDRVVHDHNLFSLKNDFIWFKTTVHGHMLHKSKENLNREDDFIYNILKIERNKEELLKEYNAIGKLIGVGFFNSVVLNIPFPKLFFKKLLNAKSFQLEDIKFIEPEIYNSLKKLESFSSGELSAMEQYFEITYDADGNCYSRELKENGKNIKVTRSNVLEFIALYVNWIVDISIAETFNAAKQGFFSVVNFNSIKDLKPHEMEKIAVGSQFIDLKLLKRHVVYSGFKEDDQIIRQFWEVLGSYNDRTLKKFVQFVTGNDRVPVIGLDKWKITILKNGCDTERLPSSQTCFNSLLLPEYSSKDRLAKKLTTAIMLTKGFFLL
ncbi:Ubiquitin-protein ligase E3A [Cucumispora dikerogammari]|nr:Ubiquitin-protein ligase E3A [Cucumispora dikerogammari]